ncbi:hypothetical protein B0H10DRAFT_1782217 [Mycena sp. CBHHK59/15]|nr:hypothetical protein B0H10DRAFT_1782217 [Mycena sp. CBHHK59/15]
MYASGLTSQALRSRLSCRLAFPALRPSAHYTTSAPAKKLYPLLGRYTVLPTELFRINSSTDVVLRDYAMQQEKDRTSYDLHIQEDGLVHPKPGPNFEGPNGMSLRPQGFFLQELIRGFKGRNITIYRLPEGLQLPDDLVCLHEHTDHHSIQCAVPMTLRTLNQKLTDLCVKHGESMTKQEFVHRYPFM